MDYLSPINTRQQLPGQLPNAREDKFISLHGKDKQQALKDLQSTAQQFESILINQMLTAMHKTVPKSGMLDSFSTETYESMLDEEMANHISKHRSLGLSDMLYKELARIQDGKSGASAAPKQVKPLAAGAEPPPGIPLAVEKHIKPLVADDAAPGFPLKRGEKKP